MIRPPAPRTLTLDLVWTERPDGEWSCRLGDRNMARFSAPTFSDEAEGFCTLVRAFNGTMWISAETVDRARAEAVEYVESIIPENGP